MLPYRAKVPWNSLKKKNRKKLHNFWHQLTLSTSCWYLPICMCVYLRPGVLSHLHDLNKNTWKQVDYWGLASSARCGGSKWELFSFSLLRFLFALTHCRPAGVLWKRFLLGDSRLCIHKFPSPPAECWGFPAPPGTCGASPFWGCCHLSSSMWLSALDCDERGAGD